MILHKQQTPSLKKIEEEYIGDFLKDDDQMFKLKQIIDELDDLDKALLIVYSDEQSMAKAGMDNHIKLAKMAVEETGMGIVEDKVIKNHFAAEYIYNKYIYTHVFNN